MIPLLIDGHLDLSMNAIEWNRDLTRPLEEIREREAGMSDRPDRGNGVVSLEEMRRGRIGVCIATFIARYSFPGHPQPGWSSPEIAWSITRAQRAWYESMEERNQLRIIKTRAELDQYCAAWREGRESEVSNRIGIVLSLEGADSILSWRHLEQVVDEGLRAIGPAHYGPGVYAPGTGSEGGLTPRGRELLKAMERLNVTLDVTHLTDEAFWESLDLFSGNVWASHNNVRSLVPEQRQLSDDQIRALAERDAVIGAVLDAWMLVPNWERGVTRPEERGVALRHVADHIDAVCQLLGTVRHSAIGSDLDGGFGREQAPCDLSSIADLQRLDELLEQRGYSDDDRRAIFYENWQRCLRRTLGA